VADSANFTMGFEGFNYLVSGHTTANSGTDTFFIQGGSLQNTATGVPGMIQGGSGTNTVNISLNGMGPSAGQINFVGNASNTDVITITNPGPTAPAYEASYTPMVNIADSLNAANSGTYEQLRYSYASGATNTSLALNYRNAGTITSSSLVNTFTVNGSSASETTQLGSGIFAVGGRGTVNYSNITNLTSTGPGPIAVTNVNITGTLTLANAAQVTGSGLVAGSLVLNNISQAGTTATRLGTNVGSLSVVNSGPVYVSEQNDLVLGPVPTSGLIDILAGGNVTSSSSLASGAALTINVGGASNITLTGQNTLTGAISLTGNTISLNNSVATSFASVNAASLTVNSVGDITQTGAIVTPIANLTASGRTITLNNAGNDFNNLTANAATVSVTDSNRIDVGSISANMVTLNTATGIGAADINGASNGQFVTNTANLVVNNSSGGVYITNNGSATVRITNSGDIGLTNNGNLIIDQLYTGGANFVDRSLYRNVRLNVSGGSVQGTAGRSIYSSPDITAFDLRVIVQGGGGFGTQARPMSLSVVDTFTYIGGRGYVYYFGTPPPNIIGAADLVNFTGLDSLFSQRLIEVESLGEFDPAIFTEVRNYYYDDVAIMMPADQRIDATDEDEKEEKTESNKNNEVKG